MRIAIIHGNDGSDVRVGKLCRTLSRVGHDVHFLGWDRRPEEKKSIDLGDASSHLLVWPTEMGRATVLGQLRFWVHILKCLNMLRPTVVSCVNEDTAIMVLPLKHILYKYLICEIFDALADRHSHRGWMVRVLLRGVSRVSRWGSDRLVITDNARLARISRYRDKCVVIENYPEDPGDEPALTPVVGPMKIFVGGSLNKGRGLRQILSAVEKCEGFRIISAGWAYDDCAKSEFLADSKVEFLGILTAKESLQVAATCDAIFAFYEPSSVNNILASPNKIYDAMSVGRPIIMNSEIKVSAWVREEGLGWSCDYHDVQGLAEILNIVENNRAALAGFARKTRGQFAEKYSWESLEGKIVDSYLSF